MHEQFQGQKAALIAAGGGCWRSVAACPSGVSGFSPAVFGTHYLVECTRNQSKKGDIFHEISSLSSR
jgi:hypothetical protein